MNDNKIAIRLQNGWLVATASQDLDYPGIDIEYVADLDNGQNLSRPRVLVECPKETNELRALIWDNPNSEDYTEDITLLSEV